MNNITIFGSVQRHTCIVKLFSYKIRIKDIETVRFMCPMSGLVWVCRFDKLYDNTSTRNVMCDDMSYTSSSRSRNKVCSKCGKVAHMPDLNGLDNVLSCSDCQCSVKD